MRRVFRMIGRMLAAIALLVVVAAGGVGLMLWYSLPGGNRTDTIRGLSNTVYIMIDPDGVPRIRAANDDDAAAALGFLHARERMFQMDLMRRAAGGTLSEIAGPATVMLDKTARTLGVRNRAEADLVDLPPDTRSLLEAYARGVNAWIALRGRFAAAEFLPFGAPAPWMPVDSLLWGKTMGLYLSGNWRTELARAGLPNGTDLDLLWPSAPAALRPEASAQPAADSIRRTAALLDAALPRFPDPFTLPASASNAWAVDATRSATGAPLLAGDPHLGFSLPGTWYLARIETPQGVLAGATAPGVPFLVIGHNGHIAWSFTTTGADTQDLFIETPVGAREYATPDGPRPFVTRDERIHVRGGEDIVLQVRETRHGPVISDILARDQTAGAPLLGAALLAVAMANLAPGDTAAAGLHALNHAADVTEAGQAAIRITSPVQNLMVADRERIALFVTGRVPVRKSGDGARPAPGADGSHDWTGWASGAQLPHAVAPASGRLVNANERIAPVDFPVFLGRDWFSDFRARRIRALLDRPERQTVVSFAAIQTDAVSLFARDVLPRLIAVSPADAQSRAALTLLARWDGAMTIDRPQPLIFNLWMRRFAEKLRLRLNAPTGATAPGVDLAAAALLASGAPRAGDMRCGGDCERPLAESLSESLTELGARFGADMTTWHWGAAHQAVFAHPMLRGIPYLGALVEARIASPGDDTTVFRGGIAGPGLESVHGAGFRGVFDLADLDRSRFVVTPGQSGHALSRLARNFVQRWRDGGTITLLARPAQVETRITLQP